jgi:uncharacterized membrane protein YdjX (TVP38/TMEM64 family)
MLEVYILLAILIFSINIIPAFMPPTWIILLFFLINFHIALVYTIIIGAISSTLGRVGLAYIARYYFTPLLNKKGKENYEAIGKYLNKNKRVSIPLIIACADSPIPSNQVYIAVGMSNTNIWRFAAGFFIFRLMSYTLWISVGHKLHNSLETIFSQHMNNKSVILLEILGFVILFAISQIPWKKILKV